MTIDVSFASSYVNIEFGDGTAYQYEVSYIDSDGSAASETVVRYHGAAISSDDFTVLYPSTLSIATVADGTTSGVSVQDVTASDGVTYIGESNAQYLFAVSGDGTITITVKA